MAIFLAAFPIGVVLLLMVTLRWSGQRAGPVGWIVGIAVAWLAFGLTPQVAWVSQAKGLLLSLYVLAIIWPALALYHLVNLAGGITAIAAGLESAIGDRGLLLITLAWAFSAVLEGLAGFGLPIAVVGPMLVALGVEPVQAVAAVAVGHAWSVTFGDMGVIFQTLSAVVKLDGSQLAPAAASLLAVVCLACGLGAGLILKLGRRWPEVVGLSVWMGGVQYALAVGGLAPLAGLGAGLAGVVGAILLARLLRWRKKKKAVSNDEAGVDAPGTARANPRALGSALVCYGTVALIMTGVTLPGWLHTSLAGWVWQAPFPGVTTLSGFITPAGNGQAFRLWVHPGTWLLAVALLAALVLRWRGLIAPGAWRQAAQSTWRSAAPASLGIISMVGLSLLMDHSGMTLLLAQTLSRWVGAAFPLVSPLVGILGAFATGSNNNSNVLFGPLQKQVAQMLAIAPALLIAAQTAGGSIGSMLAPAKIIVGCSTTGLKGRDGEVMRLTVPYGLAIGLGLGLLALIFSRLSLF